MQGQEFDKSKSKNDNAKSDLEKSFPESKSGNPNTTDTEWNHRETDTEGLLMVNKRLRQENNSLKC